MKIIMTFGITKSNVLNGSSPGDFDLFTKVQNPLIWMNIINSFISVQNLWMNIINSFISVQNLWV